MEKENLRRLFWTRGTVTVEFKNGKRPGVFVIDGLVEDARGKVYAAISTPQGNGAGCVPLTLLKRVQ